MAADDPDRKRGREHMKSIIKLGAPLLVAAAICSVQARAQETLQGRLIRERAESEGRAVADTCIRKVAVQLDEEKDREVHCDCPISPAERLASIRKLEEVGRQAKVRCEIKGVDAQIAFIRKTEDEHLARLKQILERFQGQVGGFEAWGDEAKRGLEEAYRKIDDLELGTLASELTAAGTEATERHLESMFEKAALMRDPRHARIGELKQFINTLRAGVRGKTRDEAKRIILGRLEGARREVGDFAGISEHLAGRLAPAVLLTHGENPSWELLRSSLDESYAGILLAVQFAEEHGSRAVSSLGKAAGVLGFLPDMIDAASILYRASVVGCNLDGLEQLRSAAESGRKIQQQDLAALAGMRSDLDRKRQELAQETQPSVIPQLKVLPRN